MDIDNLVNQLTLDEKASLCSGSEKNMWQTEAIERLGIPSITMTDGPYGVVKRLSGFSDPVPSTCFPVSCAMSSSWDINLIYNIGKAIGEECQAENVNILFGPSMNIQRSPLGGRNFEYYSEDPILSSEMASAFVKGVQSQGVGACLKHFMANNSEYLRQNINNVISEQPFNEIYLYNFQRTIKSSNPYTIMTAYNKVNWEYCVKSRYLLTEMLRNKFYFDGFVLSDWYGVDSIVDSLKAGLDLEMPYSYGISKKKIIDSVNNGDLDESTLNEAVKRILKVVFKVKMAEKPNAQYSREEHNKFAREAAGDCIVLLKNENSLLPLKKEKLRKHKLAIIGEYAKNPRYQGNGSAHVAPTVIENGYDEIIKLVGNSVKINYSKGYNLLTSSSENDNLLINEAQKNATKSDVAIIFLGTPDSYDGETADRTNLDLPANQVNLIKEIYKVQKNIIVVLYNGSPVIFSSWYKYANSIIEAWLPGQAGAGAIADILFGIVNPSGKLSCTFPIQLPDNPTYLDYISPDNNLFYREDIFVGYKYYDKKNMQVQFPFGFGLSYTYFCYSNLELSKNVIKENDTLDISFTVKNIGSYFGKEASQLYVQYSKSPIPRPIKELKAFAKVPLNPNEEKSVNFTLNSRDFAYYDILTKTWQLESGPVRILVGKSSRDICLVGNIYIQSSYQPKITYTAENFARDFLSNPKTQNIIQPLLMSIAKLLSNDKALEQTISEFLKDMPIKKWIVISRGSFTEKMLAYIIALANTD